MTSIASGRSRRRSGLFLPSISRGGGPAKLVEGPLRRASRATSPANAGEETALTHPLARSGKWLSCRCGRRTAPGPSFTVSRSTSRARMRHWFFEFEQCARRRIAGSSGQRFRLAAECAVERADDVFPILKSACESEPRHLQKCPNGLQPQPLERSDGFGIEAKG